MCRLNYSGKINISDLTAHSPNSIIHAFLNNYYYCNIFLHEQKGEKKKKILYDHVFYSYSCGIEIRTYRCDMYIAMDCVIQCASVYELNRNKKNTTENS